MQTTDVLGETVLYFSEINKYDRDLTARQLERWRNFGLVASATEKHPQCARIYLEWAKKGPCPVTSAEALERFFRALNGEGEIPDSLLEP